MSEFMFKSGDPVYYVLPKGNGRAVMVYLPAKVVRVTRKRIVIRVDGQTSHRNVLPISLSYTKPESISGRTGAP